MKHPIIFLLMLLPLILSFYACDKEEDLQIPDTITTAEALNDALEAIYEISNVPGFAVTIVKDDAIIYQESFGQADVQENKAYTNQTIQPIGSISKTFVAAAIVKAIEEGYFTLETPINELLPFEITHPDDRDAVIKIKHLVTHTSGLLDDPNFYLQSYHILPEEDLSSDGAKLMQESLSINQRETIPLGDYLKSYYSSEGSSYDAANFGTIGEWHYSNIATSLAAYLVETATATPFQEYVITKILRPLGMSNTAYQVNDLDTNLMAKLYWDINTPLPLYFNDSYPDGSINTNSEDLSKLLIDMMKGVKGESEVLFSEANYTLLFNPLLVNDVMPASFGDNQSVFWFLKDHMFQHSGSDPGTTCDLKFDLTGEYGYFIMSNMDASSTNHVRAWQGFSSKVHQVIMKYLQAN